jgi:hypothetical protein
MNPTARVPKWFPPLSLAVCATMIALGSFVWHFVPLRVTGQAFLLVMILHAFCYWPPMVRLVAGMPVLHRIVFGVLLGAMILGHYSLNGRSYFPFVTWEIFPVVDSDNPVTCNEFIATTNDGSKVRLLVEQLFPSIVQIAPASAFDDTRYYPPETTAHLAQAMAKIYNQHHPGNPVFRVDLMRLSVDLHPPASESRAHPSCELLKTFDVSSGQ